MDKKLNKLMAEEIVARNERMKLRDDLKEQHRTQLKNQDRETKAILASHRKAAQRYMDEVRRCGGDPLEGADD